MQNRTNKTPAPSAPAPDARPLHLCGRGRTPGVAAIALAVTFLGSLYACSEPVTPAADCALVVSVAGSTYEADPDLAVSSTHAPTEMYSVVSELVDCVDHTVDGEPVPGALTSGQSTFLPAGTALYPIQGFEPETRLSALLHGEWIVLVRK